MKKLMIAAAITVCAAAVNASTVQWASSAIYVPVHSTSVGKESEYVKANNTTRIVNATVYEFAVLTAKEISEGKTDPFTKYLAMTAEELYKADIKDASNKIPGSSTGTGALTVDGMTDFGQSDYARGVVIYTFNDGVDDWYAAYALTSTEPVGTGIKVNAILSTSKTDVSAWNKATAAPEPTSGLLLLLGVAGLALRRRRA